jgi:hypothetical protein
MTDGRPIQWDLDDMQREKEIDAHEDALKAHKESIGVERA